MAIKFSQFNLRTESTATMYLVGYDGNQNIHITADNLFGGYISGTEHYLPVFGPGGTSIIDSIVSQDAGATILTIGGQLNVDAAATFDTSIEVTGDSTLNGNVTLGNASGDLITQTGTLYLNGPIKDTTDTLGGLDQFLVSDASGEVTWMDLSAISVGTAEQTAVYAKNTSGSTILKGTPVYITGTVGATDVVEISPADASNAATMPALGLVADDVIHNAFEYVVTGGYLTNLTTDPIDGATPTSNDTVYVKSGGGLTLDKPTGSDLIQNIAKVGKVSGGNAGSLVVSSILRTNDVPNLTQGKIWVGSTGNTIESSSITFTEATGAVQLNEYGSGTITGTATYNLSVDASGNIIETSTADANTTYDLDSLQVGSDVAIVLVGSDSTIDTVTLVAGTNITLTDDGSANITIDSSDQYTGTVTSVDTANSTFISGSGGPITTTGSLTYSLSATGTPSASTYLRGDNTWATLPADNNTYVTSASFNTGDGVLTLTRNDAGTVTVDLDGRYVTTSGVTSVATSAPITGGTITSTGTIGITQATTSTDGYLSSTDWTTFNNKQDTITTGNLTETTSSILTITGGTGAVIGSGTSIAVSQATASTSGYLSSTDWNTFNNKTSNTGTVTSVAASAGTGISIAGSPITTSGTLTITNTAPNVTTDLSTTHTSTNVTVNSSDGTDATINAATTSLAGVMTAADKTKLDGIAPGATANTGTVTSVATSAPITGGTITTSGTIGITQATASTDGYLSSTDWNTFNGKQDAITNPVTGTGVATRVAFWSSTSALSSNSNLYWDNVNSRLGIGTTLPSYNLDVNGNTRVSGQLWINDYIFHNGDSNTYIGYPANDTIAFVANSTNVMRITSTARVGIGTTSPLYTLDVTGTFRVTTSAYFNQTAYFNSTLSKAYFGNNKAIQWSAYDFNDPAIYGSAFFDGIFIGEASGATGTNPTLSIHTFNNQVGINTGTSSLSYDLQLANNSAAKPTSIYWTTVSDERVKTNIRPYEKGLAEVIQLQPKLYDYNGKAGFDPNVVDNIGIIAQEAITIFPEAINTYHAKLEETDIEKTELYNVDFQAMTFAMINAIKELNEKVQTLEQEINTLKNG